MLRDDILERLDRLDEEADLVLDHNKRYKMIILGGSALTLQKWLPRATLDIDAVDVSPELRNLIEKYDINMRAEAYIDHAPYNYPDRVKRVEIGGRAIDYYTLSLEDLVITKLCSVRDTDHDDLEKESVRESLNWELLDYLATDPNELRASIISDREYNEFLGRYQNYVERWKP